MGVTTLKLDDVLESRLREKAAHFYGLTREWWSRAVADALSRWLRSGLSRSHGPTLVRYTALRDGKAILRAESLRQLAAALKKEGIDIRAVEVRSSVRVPSVERLGLRVAKC